MAKQQWPSKNPQGTKTTKTPPAGKTYSLSVRKAAARAAVTASKKTGRPVDPRVAKLADS